MSDPSLAMQKAVVARLKATAGVTALVGQRIYDRVPQDATFPYVEIGDFQSVDDSAPPCVDGCEVFIEIQVWSRAVGQVEAKQIASAVRAALNNHTPTLDDPHAAVGPIEHRDTRSVGAGDGLTTRMIVNFRAFADAV
jgi:hypothetical protein